MPNDHQSLDLTDKLIQLKAKISIFVHTYVFYFHRCSILTQSECVINERRKYKIAMKLLSFLYRYFFRHRLKYILDVFSHRFFLHTKNVSDFGACFLYLDVKFAYFFFFFFQIATD